MRPTLKHKSASRRPVSTLSACPWRPLHVGSPQAIGIADLGRPDFGDPVAILPGEVPVFWACGVTPQAVALEARPEFMITHEPGIMFLTDLPREGDTH
jgi:uncharacterized protein YcsI (UPF0317 family)